MDDVMGDLHFFTAEINLNVLHGQNFKMSLYAISRSNKTDYNVFVLIYFAIHKLHKTVKHEASNTNIMFNQEMP